MIFLFLLAAIGAYGASRDDAGPLNMSVYRIECNNSRVYQRYDGTGMRTTSVDYRFVEEHGSPRGDVVIENKEERCRLKVSMGFTKDTRSLQQTRFFYESARIKEGGLLSSFLPTKSTGVVQIVAPGYEPIYWEPCINRSFRGCKSEVCATINADSSTADITQYFFGACGAQERFFVRMCVRYGALNSLNFYWGKESCDAGGERKIHNVGERVIVLQ